MSVRNPRVCVPSVLSCLRQMGWMGNFNKKMRNPIHLRSFQKTIWQSLATWCLRGKADWGEGQHASPLDRRFLRNARQQAEAAWIKLSNLLLSVRTMNYKKGRPMVHCWCIMSVHCERLENSLEWGQSQQQTEKPKTVANAQYYRLRISFGLSMVSSVT